MFKGYYNLQFFAINYNLFIIVKMQYRSSFAFYFVFETIYLLW